jgi:hypothetical protein
MNILNVSSFAIAALSLLVAIIALRRKRQTDEAAAQRASRSPDLKLYVFGYPLEDTNEPNPKYRDWIFIRPGTNADNAIFFIPFIIANEGSVQSRDIIVTVTVPKAIHPVSLEETEEWQTRPSLPHFAIQRAVDEVGKFSRLTYVIPSLAPKEGASIEDVFIMHPTFDHSTKVKCETLDNVSLEVPIRYVFAFRFGISIRSLSTTYQYYLMEVGVIAANSMKEGVEKYVDFERQTWLAEINARPSIFRRWIHYFTIRWKWKWLNFLTFNVEQEIETSSATKMYFMKPSPELPHAFTVLGKRANDIEFSGAEDWPGYKLVTVIQMEKRD